jgi:ABC-type antimicrobial peptide transport system permease subunit
MALGATRPRVVRLVMGEAAVLVLAGLILGIAGGLALTRIASSLLFGLDWRDPATFAGAAVLLGLVAALGSFLPAFRASRLDPLRVLRYE